MDKMNMFMTTYLHEPEHKVFSFGPNSLTLLFPPNDYPTQILTLDNRSSAPVSPPLTHSLIQYKQENTPLMKDSETTHAHLCSCVPFGRKLAHTVNPPRQENTWRLQQTEA